MREGKMRGKGIEKERNSREGRGIEARFEGYWEEWVIG